MAGAPINLGMIAVSRTDWLLLSQLGRSLKRLFKSYPGTARVNGDISRFEI